MWEVVLCYLSLGVCVGVIDDWMLVGDEMYIVRERVVSSDVDWGDVDWGKVWSSIVFGWVWCLGDCMIFVYLYGDVGWVCISSLV